ncbi:MAG: hypothetical protein Q9207_002073 [Kuettlingeria erythrocarpa]
MDFNPVEPEPLQEDDDSTAYTAATPSETVAPDLPDDDSHLSDGPKPDLLLVPWPKSAFIIRSISSGEVITLLDGQINLTRPGGHGCIYWACVESKGWLGFQNVVSGAYLGHDRNGKLCCTAKRQQEWERFTLRPKPEGGCVLLMTHWCDLRHVGIVMEQGVEKLAKVGEGGSDGIVWEFLKV